MAQKKIEEPKEVLPKTLRRIRRNGKEEREGGKRIKTIWHAEF